VLLRHAGGGPKTQLRSACELCVCVCVCVCVQLNLATGTAARHPRRRCRRRRHRLHRFRTKPINNAQTPGVHALVKNHERERRTNPPTHPHRAHGTLAGKHKNTPRQTNAPFLPICARRAPLFYGLRELALPPELRHYGESLLLCS
jgi:hypothetical protein